MFRNLRFYQVTSPWPATTGELDEQLGNKPFTPCSAFADRSAGWVPPGGEDGGLCRSLMGADLLQLRTQSRVLPPAAIREVLEERVAEFQARVGTVPPRRELLKLKEEVRDQLLPQALVRSDHGHVLFLREESLLATDAGTPAKAEWLIDHLRFCLTPFACRPLAFHEPVAALMHRLFMGRTAAPFTLGRECRLQDPTDASATGAWRNVELDDDSIRHHVREGFRLTHLGLGFDDYASFVLSDEGVISKFRFIEGQAADSTDDESPAAVLDAELALLIGVCRRLVRALEDRLGGRA